MLSGVGLQTSLERETLRKAGFKASWASGSRGQGEEGGGAVAGRG